MRSYVRKLALGLILFAGVLSTTCDNSIGLGSIVDTSRPVIQIITDYGTGPGAYLSGTKTIYINATDDTGVKSVTATYTYFVYDEDGKLEEQPPVQVNVPWNESKGCYAFDIDTEDMADGTLKILVKAMDITGKETVTPELIYTVKNNPSLINMQIPKARPSVDKVGKYKQSDLYNEAPYPIVVTDNYLMGVFEDLAGVAGGYPQIKFWKADEDEPGTEGTDYTANAGWAGVTLPLEKDPGDGWVPVDEGFVDLANSTGDKGGSFRYNLRTRDAGGRPLPDGLHNGLDTGTYNLKLRAQDINGIATEWPMDAYSNSPSFLTVELTADSTPPVVIILNPLPDQLFQRDDFFIEAEAFCQGDAAEDIEEIIISVAGRNSAGDRKQVILKHWSGSDTGNGIPVHFGIQLGKTYYNLNEGDDALIDDRENVPPDAFSFVEFIDGNFNFSVIAYDDTSSKKDAPLSIYVDQMPPVTTVTGIEPYFSQDKISDTVAADAPNNNIHDYNAPDPYRRWTVNSTVRISVNSTDARGNAEDEATGYMKFKYFFLKDHDMVESAFADWKNGDAAKTFGQYLYEYGDAQFFDHTRANHIDIPAGVTGNANPLIKVEGSDGAYTLTLQTHKWDAAAADTPYKLWFYIVAMDNAGNISYAKILLNVDQETDKPRTVFNNINADGSTFMDDKYSIRLDVTDDDGIGGESVKYRFAKSDADKAVLESDINAGWHALAGIIDEDGLGFHVSDLSLKRIACDLMGHTYDPNHMETDAEAHKAALGPETDTKYIQIWAKDDPLKKVYDDTDGSVDGYSEWRSFTMDLTYPELEIIMPEKDGAYKSMPFAWGDINELNLSSITVKIDGEQKYSYRVDTEIQYESSAPSDPGVIVWKTAAAGWNGELSCRIPMTEIFDDLEDGSHTFELSAEDKVPQTKTKSLTFYKDSEGPLISMINPGQKIYMSDAELAAVNAGDIASIEGLQQKFNDLSNNTIKDASAKLIGNFSDAFSAVFSPSTADEPNNVYWYKIDDGAWTAKSVPDFDITDSKTVAWQIDLPAAVDDGIHRLSLRVKDSWGNGYGASAADNAAVDALNMVRTFGGPGFETDLAFMLDRSIPKVNILTPNPFPDFINSDLTITGTVTNTVSVKKLSVRMDGNEIALWENGVQTVPNPLVKPDIISVNLTPGVEKSSNFSVTVQTADLSEKSYSVVITATGASEQSDVDVRNFTFDKTAPSVLYNAPSVGELRRSGNLSDNGRYSIYWGGVWVTGQVKISGSSDDHNGISKIYYHLGQLGDDQAADDDARDAIYNDPHTSWTDTLLDEAVPAAGWSGGLYYWTYTEGLNNYQFNPAMIEHGGPAAWQPDPAPGNSFYLPIYVRIVDRAGNISIAQYKIFVDPDMDIPQANISSPNDNAIVGGEVRISGTANDNNWVHSVEIRIKDTTKSTSDPANYYYRNTADDWVYGPPVSFTGEEPKNNGWVKAKIQGPTDMVVAWFYNINGDGRLNPESGLRSVLIEVRALDTKDARHEIPDLTGDAVPRTIVFSPEVPTISVPKIEKEGVDPRDYSDGIRVSGKFKMSATVRDAAGISSIRVRQTGQAAFTEIVKDGEVDASVLGWDVTPPPLVNQNDWERGWRYYILDDGGITNWEDIDLVWTENKTYGPGVMFRYKNGGTEPPNGSGATAIRAAGDRATTDYVTVAGADVTAPEWDTQFFEYELDFEVDTVNLTNAQGIKFLDYGKTGNFTLELQVYNNVQPTPYNTNGTYTLGVDNFYPRLHEDAETMITTQYNAATSNFVVSGTAKDYDNQSGSIQALERVLVYFEKGGTYYNPRGVAIGEADAFYASGDGNAYSGEWATIPAMETRYDVLDYTRPLKPNPYEPNTETGFPAPVLKLRAKGGNIWDVWESPHAMVIDKQEIGETTDTDKDGTFGEMWEGQADKYWQARLDTTKFPDGPITVHYIVMDQAGNAAHYQENIYIGNNRPLIREIRLGTDINKDGIVAANEHEPPFTVGAANKEITTNFRIRNERFNIMLDTLYGNPKAAPQKHYKVSYVERSLTPVDSDQMHAGGVYTIEHNGDTEWTHYGALSNEQGTTFVALGAAPPTDDQGTAWEYTYVSGTGTEVSGSFPTQDQANNILFTDFTNILDSVTKDGNGDLVLNHNRYFIIKVYDTTVSGGTEDDQLAHVVLINVDIDNDDKIPPKISIEPFYWNGLTDNSVFDSGTAAKRADLQGHIELEDDLDFEDSDFSADGTGIFDFDPKVSGKVSFHGTASDNIAIGKIYFSIDGHTAYGITGTTVDGETYYLAAEFSNGSWTLEDLFDSNGWKFEIEDETLNQDGHFIRWKLDYDSSFINGVARPDNILSVIAQDTRKTTLDPAGPNTSVPEDYRFDVVPYISAVVTQLSGAYSANPSAFNRSALGSYPVRENEIITINGFNFGSSGTTTGVTINGTPLTYNAATTVASGNFRVVGMNEIQANVGTTTTSGELTVKVNNFESLNNNNNNNAAGDYNMERNGLNNNNLNDNRSLYIWNTGFLVNDSNIQGPFMRTANNSVRYTSFGKSVGGTSGSKWKVIDQNTGLDTTTGIPVVAASTTAEAGSVAYMTNRFFYTTLAVSNNEWASAASNITSGTSDFNMVYNNFNTGSSAANGGTTNPTVSRQRILGLGQDPFRIKYPRVAVQRTSDTKATSGAATYPARLLVSYYEPKSDTNNPIVLHNGTFNGNVTWAGNIPNDAGGGTAAAGGAASTTYVVADKNSAKARSGQYTAIGFLSNGRPVIAWYDSSRQCLWFSYSNTIDLTTSDSATAFQTSTGYQNNAVKIGEGVGTHVDLAVDDNNNVHLAYVDVRNGGLWYTYIPYDAANTRPNSQTNAGGSYESNSTPSDAVITVRVDTFLSTGTKLMINVRDNRPYISYIHNAFAETQNSVRVAWSKKTISDNTDVLAGSNANDEFTGEWEVMTVPAGTIPLTDEYVCNGVPTSGDLAAPPTNSTLRAYTGMNKTILVGYMTQNWYEGAVLKANIVDN